LGESEIERDPLFEAIGMGRGEGTVWPGNMTRSSIENANNHEPYVTKEAEEEESDPPCPGDFR